MYLNELISDNDFIELMQESFSLGQDIIFTPTGTSMLPMLDGAEDKVTLSVKPDRLRCDDVAFYRRPDSGHLVLHRMIGFTKSGEYIFCGDNQLVYEYGIKDKDILALMTAFTHKGKERHISDASYRFYVARLKLKRRARRFIRKIYHKIIK